MCKKILIAGIGNLLFTDEGVGVHVVRELRERELGSNIQVTEVGTATLDLPILMEGKDKVIIVDAVLSDEAPGSILRLTPGDLKSRATRTLTSIHQLGVQEALVTASQMGFAGEVVIVGAVPKDHRTPSMQLTPELSRALPAITEAIIAETEP